MKLSDLQKKLYPFLVFCALAVIGLLFLGCQSAVFNPDVTTPSLEGNDKTLAMNACSVALDRGVQVCRVKEGGKITIPFHAVLPQFKDSISTEIVMRFNDVVKTYNVHDSQFVLPWSEFFNSQNWSTEHDGLVQIIATTKGESYYTSALGYVYIIVLKPGYNPLPLLKKEERGSVCKIVYSENGRSSMYCVD